MNPRATGVIRMQVLWYLNSSQRAQRKPLLCGTKGEYQNCPPQDPKAPTANSMKAQDRRGQICTISQLKYYYRNQYIYHLNHFHKNEGFCWLDFKLGGNYQIFQVSEPRLLFGRQILGIRISNLSDNYFPKYFILSHFDSKKITKAKKEWKMIKESMINIEPKAIFKFDQLWRWLSPLTTAAAKGGKSDEAPSGAKIRPNGKETKQFETKKQPNWAPQVIRLYWYLWPASVNQSAEITKLAFFLSSQKSLSNIRLGKHYFENIIRF